MHGYTSGLKKIISLILVISMAMSLSLNCITITYSDETESAIDSFKSQCENAVQNIKDYTKLKAESEKLTAQYDSFSDTDKQDEYARIALNKVQDTVSDLALAEMNNKFNSLKDRYNQGKYNINNINDFESAAKEVTDIQQDIQVKHEDQIKQINIEIETMRSNITTKIVVEEDAGNNSNNTLDTGEVAPYDVKFTWTDVGDNCVLSEDGTHAVFTNELSVKGSNHAVMDDFLLEISFNKNISADDNFYISIPDPFMVMDMKPVINNIIDENIFIHNDMRVRAELDTRDLENRLSQHNIFKLKYYSREHRVELMNDVPAGTKVTIPIHVYYWTSYSGQGSSGFVEYLVKDGLGQGIMHDSLGRTYEISYETHDKANFDVSIRNMKVTNSPITKNYREHRRVWSWNPYMSQAYGISKEEFTDGAEEGYAYFEYRSIVDAYGNLPAGIEFTITPSNDGVVCGSYVAVNPDVASGTSMQEKSSKFWRFEKTNKGSTIWSSTISGEIVQNIGSYNKDGDTLRSLENAIRNNRLISANYTVKGLGLNTLIKYKLNDIYSNDTTECSCKIDVDIISIFSNEKQSASLEITNVQPYTNTYSNGETYAIGSYISHDINTAQSFMSMLQLGFNKVGGNYFSLNGWYRMPNNIDKSSANLLFDAVSIYDSYNKQHIILGDKEYEFSNKIQLNVKAGEGYFNEKDELIYTEVNPDKLDDFVNIYVLTWDSPNDWILDKRVQLKDLQHVGVSNVELNNTHIIGIRAEYPERDTFCSIDLRTSIYFYSNGNIKTLVNRYYNNEVDTPNFYFFGGLVDIDHSSHKSLVNLDETHVSEDVREVINNRSKILYNFAGMNNGFPLRSLRNTSYGTTELDSSYGISAIMKQSDNKEVLSWGANKGVGVYEVDYWIGAMLSTIILSIDESNINNIDDSSPLLYNKARFFIKIPENSEVINVVPGITSNKIFNAESDLKNNIISDRSFSTHNIPSQGKVLKVYLDEVTPKIKYNIVESSDGTVLVVDSTLNYDHRDSYTISKFKGMLFGNFTVCIQPKYSDEYTQSNDARIEVAAYILDNNGQVYTGDNIFSLRNGPSFSDTQGNVHIMNTSCTPTILNGVYVSGLNLAAKGLKDRLWSRNATIKPGDTYQYRIRYSQMSEKSKDVILFDSVEDLSPASQSYITSLNLDDAIRQGISYTVYGNKQQINSNEYVNNNADRSILTTDNGWFEITDVANLKDSEVKSIAVDFGDTQFENGVDGKPFSVDVIVNMQSASDGYNYGDNIVKNKAFFSDLLLASNKSRSAQTSEVTVNINTEADYELLKQIVGPNEQETNNKRNYTINEENEEYTYRLTYTLKDGQTSNVIIHDNIEESIKSRYAGTITGIDCTGCGEV